MIKKNGMIDISKYENIAETLYLSFRCDELYKLFQEKTGAPGVYTGTTSDYDEKFYYIMYFLADIKGDIELRKRIIEVVKRSSIPYNSFINFVNETMYNKPAFIRCGCYEYKQQSDFDIRANEETFTVLNKEKITFSPKICYCKKCGKSVCHLDYDEATMIIVYKKYNDILKKKGTQNV